MDSYKSMKSSGCDTANKAKAKKMLGDQGSAPNVIYSKGAANKDKMRLFKEGGSVKKNCK